MASNGFVRKPENGEDVGYCTEKENMSYCTFAFQLVPCLLLKLEMTVRMSTDFLERF